MIKLKIIDKGKEVLNKVVKPVVYGCAGVATIAIAKVSHAAQTVPAPDLTEFSFPVTPLIAIMGIAVTVLGGIFVYRKVVKSTNRS